MGLKDKLKKARDGFMEAISEPEPGVLDTELQQEPTTIAGAKTPTSFTISGVTQTVAGHVDEELRAKCSLHIFGTGAESDYVKFKETLDALRTPEDTNEAKLYKQAFNVERKKAKGALTKASLLVSISLHEQRLEEVRRAAEIDLAKETQSQVGSIQDQSQSMEAEIADLNAKIRQIQSQITELQNKKAQNEVAVNSAKKQIEAKREMYNATLAFFTFDLNEGKEKISKFIGG